MIIKNLDTVWVSIEQENKNINSKLDLINERLLPDLLSRIEELMKEKIILSE
jgi:hypothetical protein